jgi:hypothetical protein
MQTATAEIKSSIGRLKKMVKLYVNLFVVVKLVEF